MSVQLATPPESDHTAPAAAVDAWDGAPDVWHNAPPVSAEILLHLAGPALTAPLPAAWGYWRDFASRYFHALCQAPATPADSPRGPRP